MSETAHGRTTVEAIDLDIAVVPPSSRWAFVRVTTSDGLCGVGEATLNRYDDVFHAWVQEARREFVGLSLDELSSAVRGWGSALGGLVARAIGSAVDQARWDLLGQRLGVPLYVVLGSTEAVRVPLYGNLNRGVPDREPATLAHAAAGAVAAGLRAVKCAPFDGVLPGPLSSRDQRARFQKGLERVAAVRQAVGPDIDVLVDCHWRFDARTSVTAVRELGAFSPYWIEAPVTERDPRAWRPARRAMDCLLAGGEMLSDLREFHAFVSNSGVDVIMPDVKYCGGVTGLLKVAAVAESLGVYVSPHNPSGPVASLASAHAVQAVDRFLVLEFPWAEWPERAVLVGGAERIRGGCIELSTAPGLGVELDLAAAPAAPNTATTPTIEAWMT